MSDYEGKHVVVTGGAGGIGTGVVNRLLAAGATCHVTYRSESSIQAFPYRHRVTAYQLDVLNGRAVTGFYSSLPQLDASIHLVGSHLTADIGDTSLDDVRRMLDFNTLSTFLCCREAIRAARNRQMTQGLRLLNVAARTVTHPQGGATAYAAAKAGVAGFTQALAEEVRAEGILVNAILPGMVDTPSNRRAMPTADHESWPSVEQVADLAVYLAGPRNTVTTGALVPAIGHGG